MIHQMPRTPRLHQVLLAALLCMACIEHAFAGWNSMGKINATPALLNEKFGCSVAIDGDWMAVGASDTTVGQARSTGAVHLFKNIDNKWTHKQTLFHPTPLALQTFGNAVSMRGGMLAVGSWGSSGFAGRVFVHTLGADDVWTLTATLEAADPQPNKAALFGWSVSIDTPTGAPPVIAVGRPNDSTQSSGAIYMFEFDGTAWTQAAKLLAPSAGARDQLGLNVSVCNGTVCGGIPLRRRVAIFERADGVWGAGVEASDEASVAGDSFGTSVASGGSFVAVGSANRATEDGQVLRAGAVIVFEYFPSRGGLWDKSNTIRLPTPIASDNFGFSLAAAPTGQDQRPTLIIGAPGFDSAASNAGAAFSYQRVLLGDWRKSDTDLWSDAATASEFSSKWVAISSSGVLAALASELPRGSIGGAFPMRFIDDFSGSGASQGSGSGTTDGTGAAGGGSGSGTTGGSTTGGGGDDGDLSGGGSANPTDSVGQGGRPRPITSLPPLMAPFGEVQSTLLFETGIQNTIVGLQTDGQTPRGRVVTVASVPDGWRLAAVGDTNGDASGDLIWMDADRKIRVWSRDGITFTAKETLRALGSDESVVASTDFDGDGVDDIITRDPISKVLTAIRMREGKATGVAYTFTIPSSSWQVVPHKLVGGLLIRDTATGAVKRVTRDAVRGTITVADAPSPSRDEVIEGIGDLDGDGNDDMVCRNPDSGDVSIWRLDESGKLIAMRVMCLNGLMWKIEGVHDWDGDGIEDLLLSHDHARRLIVMHVLFEDGQSTFGSNLRIGNMGKARLLNVADR